MGTFSSILGTLHNTVSISAGIHTENSTKTSQKSTTSSESSPININYSLPGNHEVSLSYHRAEKIQQRLTNAILLEDKSFTLEGIKFYGAPWNTWRFWAFSRAYGLGADELGKKLQLVPEDTDIMVTHNPPYGILDSGRKKFWHATSE